MSTSVARGHWNSRFGFILAAAGSAIGLGNIWRFPYTAGTYGGGAFVLMYLGFVFVIGVPVLLSELAIGRATQQSPVTAFKTLVPSRFWPLVGGLGVLTGFAILSYYSVIAGLTVGYVGLAVTGRFSGDVDAAAVFGSMSSNSFYMIGLSMLFLVVTAFVVQKGVSGGIERAAKVLMPTFFVFLLFLVGRALTLPGAGAGVEFLFAPDFSKIGLDGVVSALGQALFSLSIGMGAMITYGSYLSKEENVPVSAMGVALFDTGIALIGGLLIFPTLFSVGADPAQGPGLVFVVMASIFDSLPAGTLFSIAFYSLLSIAALTSTISLLEVITAYFVDERGWRRGKAAWTVTAACALLAVPSALSLGAIPSLTGMFGGNGFLGLLDAIFGNISLSVGATLLCVFVAWVWGVPRALEAIEGGGHRLPGRAAWGLLVRWICPLAISFVLVMYVVQNVLPVFTGG
ncbi:MAG: sodium-dependent transporter [Acidobacteriota bacterium]